MQTYKIAIISGVTALSLLAAVPALAEGQGMPGDIGRGMGRPFELLFGKGRPMIMQMMGGKVLSVSAPNFTLELPALGAHATSTVTVATNASTTFALGKNSATFADIAAGQFAMVRGSFATSTQTLTAMRVELATTTPNRGEMTREVVHNAIEERFNERLSSSTPPREFRGFIGGILQGLRDLFRR